VYYCSDGYRLEMVRSTHQRRDEGYTKRIRIRKSGRVEMYWTCNCINEFNAVTPYKTLGKLSDIPHLNNRNNQLER